MKLAICQDNGKKSFLDTLFYFVLSCITFVLALFLAVFLSSVLDVNGMAAIHVIVYAAFLGFLALKQILLSRFCGKLCPGRRWLAVEMFLFVLVFEVLLIMFGPAYSFVPEKALLGLGIIQRVDNDGRCHVLKQFAVAKDFFENSSLDFDKVRIFYSWVPRNHSMLYLDKDLSIAGVVLENTIYLDPPPPCVSSRILVHELVHVWQFQNKTSHGVSDFLQYVIRVLKQIVGDFMEPYDYGGIEGLKRAKSAGKKLKDFNIEQQAKIVEHYFLAKKYRVFYSEDPDAFAYLQYFAADVLERK